MQLHAAVVELSAGANAEIKYSTVQNWYAGNEEGVGGIYNFVTKRGLCHGANAKISWTQVPPAAAACKGCWPSSVLCGQHAFQLRRPVHIPSGWSRSGQMTCVFAAAEGTFVACGALC